MKKKFFFILLTLAISKFAYAGSTQPRELIAIISAMPSETSYLVSQIKNSRKITRSHQAYTLGKIGDKSVIITSIGIGKVNAAIGTTNLITNFNPSHIILTGIAGGINTQLKVGDVVIANKIYSLEAPLITFSRQNKDDWVFDRKKPPLYIITLPLPKMTKEKSNVFSGKIATTDIIPSPIHQVQKLKQQGFEAIDMESYAVAYTAWIFNKKLVVVRGISDFPYSPISNQKDSYIIKSDNKSIAV